MSNKISTIISVVALVVALAVGFIAIKSHGEGLVGISTPTNSILIENYDPYVRTAGGINTNYPVNINSDLTVGGGTISVTSTNAATSSIIVGCIQTYATSTANPIVIAPVSTTTILTGLALSASFGTCPNL